MARDNKKHRGLSDGELREMFMDIGRSKEETARSIVEKQRQEEEERHKRFRNRLFHSKSIEIDDDVDIDEETAALEREIELVRAGKIHKYLDQSPGQEEGEQAKLPETVLIEVDNSSSQHMVYEYSESCIKYIQKAKEIVLKCHIRLTDETWTTEQIVTQSLVEGMAKKAIK